MEQVPSCRICAVLVEQFERVYRVALGLAHLLAVLVQDQVIYENILVWRSALDECGYSHQRVEPSSGLVYTFAYEISREQLFIEVLAVFKRIVLLCERHCSAVEPAVHYFRYSRHRLAAVRACKMHVVNIRSVQFDVLSDVFLSFFNKFSSAAYAFQMAAFTSPDRDRCSPVSVSGYRPVVDVFEPVSESLFSYEIREPVDHVVVCNELILELCHFYIPARLSIVKERSAASPAVRIVVLHLFLRIDLVLCCEPLYYIYVKAVFHYESALPRSICVFALFIYRIHYRKIISPACVVVIFTESRCSVYDTCTVFDSYVVCACNEECFLVRSDERH